jgi:hypothetical protein
VLELPLSFRLGYVPSAIHGSGMMGEFWWNYSRIGVDYIAMLQTVELGTGSNV